MKYIYYFIRRNTQTIYLWFSLDTAVSSTNNTDQHDITRILLKVALNTIHHKQQPQYTYKL